MFTKEQAEQISAEWVKRAKKYKSRKYDNDNQQDIEDYLIGGLVAWGDGEGIDAYHKMMLEKGEWFLGRKIAKDYPSCATFKRQFRPKIKECYHNAQTFLLHDLKAKYYEGFFSDGFFAIQHGWTVMPDGKVVDFTLEARDSEMKRRKEIKEGTSLTDIAYLGVEVPRDFVLKKMGELKVCTLIAHMHYLGDDRQFLID